MFDAYSTDPFSETRTGYLKHIKKYTDPVQNAAAIKIGAEGADAIDMTGKVVCISGANSGIGFELSKYCSAKGAKVYMFCRSRDRAEKAKKEIVEATSNHNIDILLVRKPIAINRLSRLLVSLTISFLNI